MLVGLALHLDETELKAIADDVDSKTPNVEVSVAEDLKFEVDSKAAEAAELRRELKDTRRELKQTSKERDQLTLVRFPAVRQQVVVVVGARHP